MRLKELARHCRGPACVVGLVLLIGMGVALIAVLLTMPRGSALPVEIDDLSADHGSLLGGEMIYIEGDGFATHGEVEEVSFGGVPGTDISVISDTLLAVRTPANGAGEVDVAISCRYSPTSRVIKEDAFTYLGVPTISDIVPCSCAGESELAVVISGTSFCPNLTSVTFNGIPSDGVMVYDCGHMVALLPELDPDGPVEIVVATLGYGAISCSGQIELADDGTAVAGWSSID